MLLELQPGKFQNKARVWVLIASLLQVNIVLGEADSNDNCAVKLSQASVRHAVLRAFRAHGSVWQRFFTRSRVRTRMVRDVEKYLNLHCRGLNGETDSCTRAQLQSAAKNVVLLHLESFGKANSAFLRHLRMVVGWLFWASTLVGATSWFASTQLPEGVADGVTWTVGLIVGIISSSFIVASSRVWLEVYQGRVQNQTADILGGSSSLASIRSPDMEEAYQRATAMGWDIKTLMDNQTALTDPLKQSLRTARQALVVGDHNLALNELANAALSIRMGAIYLETDHRIFVEYISGATVHALFTDLPEIKKIWIPEQFERDLLQRIFHYDKIVYNEKYYKTLIQLWFSSTEQLPSPVWLEN